MTSWGSEQMAKSESRCLQMYWVHPTRLCSTAAFPSFAPALSHRCSPETFLYFIPEQDLKLRVQSGQMSADVLTTP